MLIATKYDQNSRQFDRAGLTMEPALFDEGFAVILHELNGICIFADVAELHNCYSLKNGRANTKWLEMVDASTQLTLSVVFVSPKFHDCVNYRARAVYTMQPICNLHGRPVVAPTRVQCNETGAIYSTAAECARVNKISPSNLSNHLNGRAGFKSIKGYTYSRIL